MLSEYVLSRIMAMDPPNDGESLSTTPISAEGFASALSNPVGRTVLFHLKNEPLASFDDLVDVAATTHPPWTIPVDGDGRRADIRSALFHLHLPKLELLGIVDWNRETREVVLRADPDRLTDWLDVSFADSVHGAMSAATGTVVESSPDIAVLFVDDDDHLASLLVEQFDTNHADIAVTTASNAQAALETLGSTTFDCIVSDYDMPGSNGLDFLKAIRHVDGAVPFVVYTGKGTAETRTKATDHGANAYLQKRGGAGQFDLLADRIRQVVADHRTDSAAGA
jgi:CheY-like chemotaxis protein